MNRIAGCTEERSVVRFRDKVSFVEGQDLVIREELLRIVVDGHELLTASLLPEKEKDFVYGFLFGIGLIQQASDIAKYKLDQERHVAFVDTTASGLVDYASPPIVLGSSCGSSPVEVSTQSLAPLETKMVLQARVIHSSLRNLLQESELFHVTGGVHSVMICKSTWRSPATVPTAWAISV